MSVHKVMSDIEQAAVAGLGPADFSSEGIKADVIAESTAATGVTIDGVLVKDNAVTASGGVTAALTGDSAGVHTGNIRLPVATVAAAGNNAATAGELAYGANVVTGADGAKGVILPAGVLGGTVIVYNQEAAILAVYPQGTGFINDGLGGAPLTTTDRNAVLLVCVNVTDGVDEVDEWISCPVTPS